MSITHTFGTTRIAAPPERVLSLGLTEQDSILALAVTPIAVRYAVGDESDVIFPWAGEAAAGASRGS